MTENSSLKSNPIVIEAPASWNTRYITPDGFICQLTLRGENGKDLLEKANAALSWLKDNGYLPDDGNRFRSKGNTPKQEAASQPNGNGNGSNGDKPNWCLIHQCEMKRWEKDGKIWYSHKANGQWCTGKTK